MKGFLYLPIRSNGEHPAAPPVQLSSKLLPSKLMVEAPEALSQTYRIYIIM